ncbi:hypothetical protein JCM31447_29920 [Fluviispira sanaruensis]|uniref:Uncharacterized protein n=2 Tax=Fluviispira sanaruensis TaxID=2493639 RepID=A0A4P2VN86_FLUSA|nr:hypothetical protein JCM31447_29920 [Fluviispira sanaruensis]
MGANIALNYDPPFNKHHFYVLKTAEIMKAANIPNNIEISENIEIGYYSDSVITVFNRTVQKIQPLKEIDAKVALSVY